MTRAHAYQAKSLVLAVLCLSAASACARLVQVPPSCPPLPPPPAAERVPLPTEPATLRGRLQSVPDSQPVSTADVALEGLEGGDRRVTTDSTGAFRFDSLPPGRYAIRFRRIGYTGRRVDSLAVDATRGVHVSVPVERMALDGCPGFMVFYERVPWWKIWRW